MGEEKKCPCCGEGLRPFTAQCPRCHLAGLNQFFLDKESYERWKREVLLPYKAAWMEKQREEERRRLERQRKQTQGARGANQVWRLYGGKEHVLILAGDGNLYGLGGNHSNQLDTGDSFVSEPRLIARDVKTAAAGCHYTIYITKAGAVKVLGSGEYADRDVKFRNATEVYARPDKDIFMLKDRNGNWAAFGNNSGGEIEERKEQCLYQFPERSYSYAGPGENLSRGPYPHYSAEAELSHVIQSACSDTFRKYSGQYPDQHLFLDYSVRLGYYGLAADGKVTSTSQSISPRIMLSNGAIYVPATLRKLPAEPPWLYFDGCWPRPVGEGVSEICHRKKVRKMLSCDGGGSISEAFGEGPVEIVSALAADGELSFYYLFHKWRDEKKKFVIPKGGHWEECRTVTSVYSMSGVYDIAFYDGRLLIATRDGRVTEVMDVIKYIYNKGREGARKLHLRK